MMMLILKHGQTLLAINATNFTKYSYIIFFYNNVLSLLIKFCTGDYKSIQSNAEASRVLAGLIDSNDTKSFLPTVPLPAVELIPMFYNHRDHLLLLIGLQLKS